MIIDATDENRPAFDSFLERRVRFLLLSAVIGTLGLAIRGHHIEVSPFLRTYAPDALWAAMIFALTMAVLPRTRVWKAAVATLVVSYMIEFSQIYHAPWIDSMRSTAIGGLILGHGFLFSDLVCYTAGIAIASAVCAAISTFQASPR